jgi:glycosyltransferase involved in cell wall biosynthesis
MDRAVDSIECAPDLDGQQLLDELSKTRMSSYVLVHATGVDVPSEALAAMVSAADAPMAASVSPLPVAIAASDTVALLASNRRLPPPPTLALGCPAVCLFSTDALASVLLNAPRRELDLLSAFVYVNQRLAHAGWRHVAAPCVALAWRPPHLPIGAREGAWGRRMVEQQTGAANEGLGTHVLWATTRVRPVRIVVDGACLTDAPHNGSQAVVAGVVGALARTRPESAVALAVREGFIAHVRKVVGDGVEVIERAAGVTGFDVAYRPYQLLDPAELTWLAEAGQRLIVGQLDMIGFANPSYHPSPALFHAVRNLQRHTMRLADAVTFISQFGMDWALAECPDLDPTRCFHVSCGTDVREGVAAGQPRERPPVEGPFIACIAATFWHKNRQHAIAVFAELCRRHRYQGRLVVAGPEPYYGRSIVEERELMASLEPDIRRRVVHLGQVDEQTKWWLLAQADVVLYPSVVEGFGLVPFEAASVGTPTLSHAGSALLEVIGDGAALVPSWSVEAWADVTAAIVDSPAHRAEVVAAVQRASHAHSWDASALHVWEAIDATLARPHSRPRHEEGGLRSRVGDDGMPLAFGARVAHLTNRITSYAERRAASVMSGRKSDST